MALNNISSDIGLLETEEFLIDELKLAVPLKNYIVEPLINYVNSFVKFMNGRYLNANEVFGCGAGLGGLVLEIEKSFLKKGLMQYQFFAYPGPEVITDENSRAEHKPYHVHVKSNSNSELRINCENLEELSGKSIPKIVKKFMGKHQEVILEAVKEVYHKGSFSESKKIEEYISRINRKLD